MMRHAPRSFMFGLSLTAVLVISTSLALLAPSGQPSGSTPLGTAFAYQGQLKEAGLPANGTVDFEFLLFDADVDGSQVGPTVAFDDQPVNNGLFTVQLDFGNVFDGTNRWLEIHVRRGNSTGAFSVLTPREALLPVPYAFFAVKAGNGVPPRAVILWLGDKCPQGYIRVSALDGRFLVSDSTYNPAAGGSNTKDISHTHSGASHTHTFTTGGPSSTHGVLSDGSSVASNVHTHSGVTDAGGAGTTGTSGEAALDIRPTFATVLLCQKE